MTDAASRSVRASNRSDALALDATDPLAPVREHFDLPPELIYLDGNSLGPLPHAARAALRDAVDTGWAKQLIASWNQRGWVDLALQLGDQIGALMGAAPGQVVVSDSTSINVFKLVAGVLRSTDRSRVLSERGMFPTDLYMTDAAIRWGGHSGMTLDLVPRESIVDALDEQTALVVLGHVDFRSGHRFDMRAISEAAHRCGAMVLWDLCHSTGAVPLELDACGVDLAVGCTYKFLNAGPGSPAYLYVANRHQSRLEQPLAGWFGHTSPFAFDSGYAAAPGIARFQCGTPPALALETLAGALSVWQGIDFELVRAKSLRLAELFRHCVHTTIDDDRLRWFGPTHADERGSQLAYAHPEAYPIMQALIDAGVVGDFRAPDLVRFGLTPLYTRYVDIWDAVDRLRIILTERRYDDPKFRTRHRVT